MNRIFSSFGVFALAFAASSCGGGGTAPPPGGGGGGGGNNCAANTFCMGSSSFFTKGGLSVLALSVPANSAVTWTNTSGIEHDVTFDDPATALAVGNGAAGNIPPHTSGTNQRQFAVSGSSHPFHCTIHGTAMHGTVNVQ